MFDLLPAALLFIGTHLGISSTGLRPRLVNLLGERAYLALYSLLSVITLVYLIWLYNNLPRYDYAWLPSPELHTFAWAVMPFALILAAGAFMVKNPTAVGAHGLLGDDGAADLATGVTRITRHPFQWGVLLWSVAHVAANGDTLSVVFFTTFGVVAGVGTVAIDRRMAVSGGAGWQAYAAVTSSIPFVAIISGRNRLKPGELWLPVLVGLGLYGLLIYGHPWVSGVRIR